MVEGHSVHRVAKLHRERLIGKRFEATSPNGRFRDGAAAIDGKVFYRIEAVGKNLFAFFGEESDPVVIHIHFGMAGAWAVFDMKNEAVPEPTTTNRLRLVCLESNITADLSAMTVKHGGLELYEAKRSKLGQDPLRSDADVELLWQKVSISKKSIGALIMDQSFFTGPGNIYRAEILFKAGIHPDIPGADLSKEEFDLIWYHTVSLLQRGFATGSILTVDPDEAIALGLPKLRRYIYNQKTCPRCSASVKVWEIASRTCYACPKCQPLKTSMTLPKDYRDCEPFVSHCASESATERINKAGASQLTVRELKDGLINAGVPIPASAKKGDLVHLWETCPQLQIIRSSEEAAAEKASAGENMAVEHIAELAPSQARRARAQAKLKRKLIAFGDITEMTVAALKIELMGSGILFPARAKKAELIELLRCTSNSVVPDKVGSTPRRKSRRRLVTP